MEKKAQHMTSRNSRLKHGSQSILFSSSPSFRVVTIFDELMVSTYEHLVRDGVIKYRPAVREETIDAEHAPDRISDVYPSKFLRFVLQGSRELTRHTRLDV